MVYLLATRLSGSSVRGIAGDGVYIVESLGYVSDVNDFEIMKCQTIVIHVLAGACDHLRVEIRGYGFHAHVGRLDHDSACAAKRVEDGPSSFDPGQVDQGTCIFRMQGDGREERSLAYFPLPQQVGIEHPFFDECVYLVGHKEIYHGVRMSEVHIVVLGKYGTDLTDQILGVHIGHPPLEPLMSQGERSCRKPSPLYGRQIFRIEGSQIPSYAVSKCQT